MANKVEIHVRVNGDTIPAELEAIRKLSEEAGSRSGDGFSSGFKGRVSAGFGSLSSDVGGLVGKAGQDIGKDLTTAAGDSAKNGSQSFGQTISEALSAAGQYVIPTAIGVGALLSPFIAQALSGGLVVGLGGALAGVGIMGAMKAAGVQKSFDNLKTAANKDLAQIGQPFQGAMTSIFNTAQSVLGKLTPSFKAAESIIAGPFKTFTDTFLKSFEQPEVKQSINAVANAFGALLSALTPQMGNDFRMIANAITSIANNVAQNPEAFSGFVNALVKMTVYSLNAVNALTSAANFIEKYFVPAVLLAGVATLDLANAATTGMHAFVDVVLTAFGAVVEGAAKAFSWVPGVGGKLQSAAAAFEGFKNNVDGVFNSASSKISGWNADVSKMTKTVLLKGDISDLTAKLSTAKNQLKDPTLTATRRAQVEANIAQLQQQLANAQAALNAINGRTVTTYVVTQAYSVAANALGGRAAGGIVGAAGGGSRSNYVMVGEHGQEMVKLPSGSTVYSNPDTQRMLAAGGGGGGQTINLEVTSGGQTAFEQFMLMMIREFVRVQGGGNVQTAFGRH